MTFSETMTEDFYNDRTSFDRCAADFIQRINEELGLQTISAIVHLDEKTPHIHLGFDNIDKTTGKGIRRTINPKKLSKAQDIMGECFEGMGYERGKKSKARHMGVKEMHDLEKFQEELLNLEIEIDKLEKVKQAYIAGDKEIIKLVDYWKKNNGKALKTESKNRMINAIKNI